jgi:gliding motility-associated-like protein
VRCGKSLIIFLLLIFLSYFQAKGQYDFTVDETEGCTPLRVKFSFVSSATVDSIDTYYWSFGNGVTSYDPDPDTVVFETAGIFDPTLVIVFASGTESWIVKPDLITVRNTTPANFEYHTPTESYFYYLFEQNAILDTALTYDFIWDVEDEDFTLDNGPTQEINFPRVDTFTVSLTVTDEFGCSSSIVKLVTVLEEIDIEIPNVFAPGGAPTNDYFIIRSTGDIPLRIRIFTRTGILVYETEGPVITWNGETASGDKLKTGIYYYALEAISGDPQKLYTKTGFIHMYRVD